MCVDRGWCAVVFSVWRSTYLNDFFYLVLPYYSFCYFACFFFVSVSFTLYMYILFVGECTFCPSFNAILFFFNILLNTGGDETGSKNVKNRVCRLIHSASSSCHDILFRVCHLNLRKNRLVVPRGLRVSWCATICFNERLAKCYPEAGALYRVKIAATMWSKSATRNELSHPRACLYPFLTSFKYFLRF